MAVVETSSLQARLKRLLDCNGPPPGLAEALLNEPSCGDAVLAILLRGLEGRPPTDASPFTEGEAVTIVLRILGTVFGDPGGDKTLTAKQCEEIPTSALQLLRTPLALSLCSEAAVTAILELLQRKSASVQQIDDEPYLRVDALKALRLQLLPTVLRQQLSGDLHGTGDSLSLLAELHQQQPRSGVADGALVPLRGWWVEEDIGHLSHGSARRQLVDVLLHSLQAVSTGSITYMGQRPQLFALCCLWILASTSATCRSLLVQRDGLAIVAGVLKTHIKAPGPPLESHYDAMCGLLSTLAIGPRLHERKLAELRVDVDIGVMMERFALYRQVVTAGFTLLGVVARDQQAGDRLSVSSQALEAIASARDRWPDALSEAILYAKQKQQLAPLLQALAEGAPLDKLRLVAAAPLRSLTPPTVSDCLVSTACKKMASQQRRNRSRGAFRSSAAMRGLGF